jgi:hypothetical protein
MPVPSNSGTIKQFGTGGGPIAAPLDQELLYSTAGFTQLGVTLGGGQGILPTGCVLGRKTSDKKYYVYATGNSDGTQVARGILRQGTDTGVSGTAKDVQGNLVVQGILNLSLVSGADSGAITTLNARSDSVLGLFTF